MMKRGTETRSDNETGDRDPSGAFPHNMLAAREAPVRDISGYFRKRNGVETGVCPPSRTVPFFGNNR